jgi:hypothetical protein
VNKEKNMKDMKNLAKQVLRKLDDPYLPKDVLFAQVRSLAEFVRDLEKYDIKRFK